MVKPSAAFIALDRNPNIPPATWPFRRLGVPAIATEALWAETTKIGSVHEGAGPKDIAQNKARKSA